MNHHHRETLHRTTLHALFGPPVRASIDVGKACHVSAEAGAEVANRAGNRVNIRLHGHAAAFAHAPHRLPKNEAVRLRKFLEACGIRPADNPI